jgi:hypothetical protein
MELIEELDNDFNNDTMQFSSSGLFNEVLCYKLNNLPVELYYGIIQYMDLREYWRLKRTCKTLMKLMKIPTLNFNSYLQSTIFYQTENDNLIRGEIIRSTNRMRLALEDLSDISFKFIASFGHTYQCIRLLRLSKPHQISDSAKLHAFKSYISKNYNPYLIEELIMNPSDEIKSYITDSYEPIDYAVRNGYVNSLNGFIKIGANIKMKNLFGMQPLHYAARNGYVDCVLLLIQFGADINAVSDDGSYALHYAVCEGNDDCVRTLLDHGANMNLRDSRNHHAIHLAIFNDFASCLKILIDRVTDLNSITYHGMGLVDYARSYSANAECIRIVVDYVYS